VTVPLVIGVGREDRGDDAVGLQVARAVALCCGIEVEVVESDQPADLLDLWSGRELVVVIDAVRSGAPPGTVQVLRLGADQDGGAAATWLTPGHGGTHDFGIDAVVGLAAALGTLPSALVLVGVEGSSFDYGAALSPAVARELQTAVAEVKAQVAGAAPDVH
jgi:hydrogenase maturation protease